MTITNIKQKWYQNGMEDSNNWTNSTQNCNCNPGSKFPEHQVYFSVTRNQRGHRRGQSGRFQEVNAQPPPGSSGLVLPPGALVTAQCVHRQTRPVLPTSPQSIALALLQRAHRSPAYERESLETDSTGISLADFLKYC